MIKKASIQRYFLGIICIFTIAITSCGDDSDDGSNTDASSQLQWFQSCGDPVCGGYMPTAGATVCTDEAVGESCSPRDVTCEVVDDNCNVDFVCTDSDPTSEGCPISRRELKRDIQYLTAAERARLAGDLLDTKLATYRYRDESMAAGEHLGFIIDDQPDSPAVRPDGQRVDLYGYTSMTVAAIQTQAAAIARLEATVTQLQAELEAIRAARSPAGNTKTRRASSESSSSGL